MELLTGVFLSGIIASGVVAIYAAIVNGDMKLATLSAIAALLFAIGWVCDLYGLTEVAYAMLGIGAVLLGLVVVFWYSVEGGIRKIQAHLRQLQEETGRLEKDINEGVSKDIGDAETESKKIDGKIEAHKVEGKKYVPEVS